MSTEIVVVGSLNMDLVVRTPRLPRPGETIIGGEAFQTLPGGKGANQAVAAARLGAQVTMVGCVGEDDFGRALLANLEAEGVDHRFVRRDEEAATGVAFIVVDDEGQNSIVVASGANHRLTPADVEAAGELFAGAEMLLLQLESPLAVVQRAAEVARAHGVTVILNPAPAQPLPPELLALVDVLVPNESETALLSGQPVGEEEEAAAAAGALRRQGVETVILTLGARGALLADRARPGDAGGHHGSRGRLCGRAGSGAGRRIPTVHSRALGQCRRRSGHHPAGGPALPAQSGGGDLIVSRRGKRRYA